MIGSDKPVMTFKKFRQEMRDQLWRVYDEDKPYNEYDPAGAESRRSFAIYCDLHEQNQGYQDYENPATSSYLLEVLSTGLFTFAQAARNNPHSLY